MTTQTYAEQRRAYVVAIVDKAPPLSAETRAALRELLRPMAIAIAERRAAS